jgi:hypothetical protein
MNTRQQISGTPPYASLLALQEFVERLASQVDSAHNEIGETRAILKDAVDRLMPAFTAARSSESFIAAETRAPVNGRSTGAIRASGPAFSALQFQDISDQLLAHAQVRLLSLLAEVNGIAAALAPDRSGLANTDQLMQLIASANDNLASLDVSLVKPVGKAHLGTGDMEFF